MWPDDYIDWALRARPPVLRAVRGFLSQTQLQTQAASLATQALRTSFDVAHDRCRYRGYFRDYDGFRAWLASVAFREAFRIYLRHPLMEPRLDSLADDQRSILGMVYLDQLRPGDVAAAFHCAPAEVSQREQQAFETLRRLP
jgi:DNA-directed RNA polymerase specialized sigma24 family protein